jgi:hypothetical protein
MNGQHPPDMLPLGLLELDPRGVVIRYAPTAGVSLRRESVVGRDFFTEVMPAGQLYGFRARFLAFMDGRRLQERFALNFRREGGALRVRVVLAAHSEQRAGRRERLALVRITPESTQEVA